MRASIFPAPTSKSFKAVVARNADEGLRKTKIDLSSQPLEGHKAAGTSATQTTPLERHMRSEQTGVQTKSALGTAGVLKAFRLIGGVEGVKEQELRNALERLQNSSTRQKILSKLHELFAKHDLHNKGTISVFEFEQMIRSSALLEKAIYQLLEMYLDEEVAAIISDRDAWEQRLEYASFVAIMLNVLVMALSIDVSQGWIGWEVIELVFVVVFSAEIFLRVRAARSFSEYLENRMNIFDVLVTFMVAIDVIISLVMREKGEDSLNVLTILRIFRLARLARLIKVVCQIKDLVVLIEGLIENMRSLLWSFVLLSLVVFLFVIVLRQSILFKWQEDPSILDKAFPSIPESMLLLFRCWVLSSEGACQNDHGVPLFSLFDSGTGWFFRFFWVACELFVVMGVLNVVASTFVLNGMRIDKRVEEQIAMQPHNQFRNTLLMKKLDKLLRTLTHPQRKLVTPRDRNVANVASYIHTNFPETAAHMTDMNQTLISFAENIQESLSIYENAMGTYEVEEVVPCKELHLLPSAKMYLIEGQERLMVGDNASFGGESLEEMGMGIAPTGAVELPLIQESDELDVLLAEADELQQHVKANIISSKENMMRQTKKTAHLQFAGRSNSRGRDSRESNSKPKVIVCDELIDPGPKRAERITEKVKAKYEGRYERNRDYARLGLVYNTVEGLLKSLKQFLGYKISDGAGMQVVSVENRFIEPSSLGWRDISILLKVRVPSSRKHHIMELQLMLKGLKDVRDETHKFYERIRAVLPEDAVSQVIDQLTSNTTLDLDITKTEWLECLKNPEVIALLDQLRIPNITRRDAIDILDADGSGSVSTAELREGLLLCSADLGVAGGIVDCKLKVREVQQWLRNKVEPQLHILQEMVMHLCAEQAKLQPTLRTFSSRQTVLQDNRPRQSMAVLQDNRPRQSMAVLQDKGGQDAEVDKPVPPIVEPVPPIVEPVPPSRGSLIRHSYKMNEFPERRRGKKGMQRAAQPVRMPSDCVSWDGLEVDIDQDDSENARSNMGQLPEHSDASLQDESENAVSKKVQEREKSVKFRQSLTSNISGSPSLIQAHTPRSEASGGSKE